MSKNILMAMIAMFIAVAPASAAELNKGMPQAGMGVANDSSNEAVDCFYEQNRFLPECKKK